MRADREAGGEGAEADADEEQPDGVRHVEPAEERLAERAEEDGEEEEGGFPLEQVAPRRLRPVAAVVATGVAAAVPLAAADRRAHVEAVPLEPFVRRLPRAVVAVVEVLLRPRRLLQLAVEQPRRLAPRHVAAEEVEREGQVGIFQRRVGIVARVEALLQPRHLLHVQVEPQRNLGLAPCDAALIGSDAVLGTFRVLAAAAAAGRGGERRGEHQKPARHGDVVRSRGHRDLDASFAKKAQNFAASRRTQWRTPSAASPPTATRASATR
jgi:hypothetical protein